MTVPTTSAKSPLSDGSPKSLLQQSARAVAGPPGPAAVVAPPDALRAMLQTLLQETLQAEFARFLGTAPFERTTTRVGVRNGSRVRTLVTRVGKLTLEVPRDRASLFTPSVFPRYQRHEQALVSTLAECYLQGVSTRKVREVVETLCGETVSASAVSRATKQLDATLAAWRARRLDAQAYPQLVIDAHYERIRREGQVLSTAALWVMGVAANGYREYLGVWLGTAESGPTWSRVFKELHQRGLHGVQYVVSDEHAGLKAAVQRYFPDAVHQRCQVHYLRNALTKVSTPTRQATLLAALRDVWAAPTRPEAAARGPQLVAALRQPIPAVADWLEETLGDTLGFYMLTEAEARRRLRTTNALEREHEEIRRRTRVIRIFPHEASYPAWPPRSPPTATTSGRSAATSSRHRPPSTSATFSGAGRPPNARPPHPPRSELHTLWHLTLALLQLSEQPLRHLQLAHPCQGP